MTDHVERQPWPTLEEKRAAAREFLERLCSQQYVICQWQAADPADPSPGAYQPVQRTIDVWLEQLFGHDAARPESENAHTRREASTAD